MTISLYIVQVLHAVIILAERRTFCSIEIYSTENYSICSLTLTFGIALDRYELGCLGTTVSHKNLMDSWIVQIETHKSSRAPVINIKDPFIYQTIVNSVRVYLPALHMLPHPLQLHNSFLGLIPAALYLPMPRPFSFFPYSLNSAILFHSTVLYCSYNSRSKFCSLLNYYCSVLPFFAHGVKERHGNVNVEG